MDIHEMFKKISEYCTTLEQYGYYYSLSEPVAESEIEAVEKKYNIKLPEEHRQFLMLANGMEMGTSVSIFPVGKIEPYDYGEYKDYFVIGQYIGDGSMLLTDGKGGFFQEDHAFGLKEKSFSEFLNKWIIYNLEDDLKDAGVQVSNPEREAETAAMVEQMKKKLMELRKKRNSDISAK